MVVKLAVAFDLVAWLRALRGSWHAFQRFRCPKIRAKTTASEPQPLLLTPVDNLMPRLHVPNLLFFPELPGSDVSTIVKTFRDGLSRSLEAIPALSGTVRGIDQKGALRVAAPWSNVHDILQVKDLRHERRLDYQSLRDKEFPMDALDRDLLLPSVSMRNPEKSVVLVQINLVKGGMIVALCTHHSYVDGSGSISIASLWAACCRGDNIAPWLTREMTDRDPLMRGWGSTDVAEFARFDTLSNAENTQEAILFFSKHKLAALKALASKRKHGEGDDAWISTNDALCALLSCCIHSTGDPNPRPMGDRSVRVNVVVNARRILHPPLPAGYIGNAVTSAIVSAPSHNLEPTPAKMAETAHLIRKQIEQVDERYVRKRISALSSVGSAATAYPLPSPPEEQVFLTSWANMDYYGLDWGDAVGARIERVRSFTARRSGFCVILPELRGPQFESKDYGLEVLIVANDQHLERLKKNELLKRFAECRYTQLTPAPEAPIVGSPQTYVLPVPISVAC